MPKTQKIELDASLLNIQHYKVWSKGKVEQSREWGNTLPYTLVYLLWKSETSGHPRLPSPTLFTYKQMICKIELFEIELFNHLALYKQITEA